MIRKIAKARQRAQRKEPEQEALVEYKDQMNERMTALIELLKDVKRGWNGGPSPEVGVPEKVNLTQPLPDSVVQSGQKALQELSGIIQGLQQVNQMQDTYAAQKAQKMQERLNNMQDRVQKINHLHSDILRKVAFEQMINKYASNRLTRLWAHIVAPFGTEKGRWQRLSMLRGLARVQKSLDQVDEVLLGGDANIRNAVYLAKELYVDAKTSFFDEFRRNLQEMTMVTKREVERTNSEIKSIEKELKSIDTGKINTLVKDPTVPIIPDQIPRSNTVENAISTLQDLKKKVNNTSAKIDLVEKKKKPENELRREIEDLVIPSDADKPQPPAAPAIQPSPESQVAKKPQPAAAVDPVQSVQSVQPEQQVTPEVQPPQPPQSPSVQQVTQEITPAVPAGQEVQEGQEQEVSDYIYKNIESKTEYLQSEVLRKINTVRHAPWVSIVRNLWLESVGDLEVLEESSDQNILENYVYYLMTIGTIFSVLGMYQKDLSDHESLGDEHSFGIGDNDPNTPENVNKINAERDAFVQQAYSELYSKASSQEAQLAAYGSKLSRFLNRMLQHVSGGKNKIVRLKIDSGLRNARKGLQNMMDDLEKRHINFRGLTNSSALFFDGLIEAFDKLSDLAENYNASSKIHQDSKQKHQLIPITDITSIRRITQSLQNDKLSIQSLINSESELSEYQTTLENVKRALVEKNG